MIAAFEKYCVLFYAATCKITGSPVADGALFGSNLRAKLAVAWTKRFPLLFGAENAPGGCGERWLCWRNWGHHLPPHSTRGESIPCGESASGDLELGLYYFAGGRRYFSPFAGSMHKITHASTDLLAYSSEQMFFFFFLIAVSR